MNMREKMARAAYDAFWTDVSRHEDDPPWGHVVDAILDAMREPGLDLLCRPMENIGLCEGDIEGAWRSVIDAIKAGK